MDKNKKAGIDLKAKRKAEEKEIVNTIIGEISEKHIFSDLEIQEYEEKLLNYLDKLVQEQEFDERDEFELDIMSDPHEFELDIMSDPHEFARKIKNTEMRLVTYNERQCEESEFREARIMGDAEVKEEISGLPESDFSLSALQIEVMEKTIYNGYVRSFDFKRTNKAKVSYNILVYIPNERDEKEDSIKTYQELIKREKRQELENKIKENEQEVVRQIMLEIGANYKLTDSLYEEYKKKIQEAIKLSNDDINTWKEGQSDIKAKIVRNPHEYYEAVLSRKCIVHGYYGDYTSDENFQVNSIIGDFKTSIQEKQKEESDFSIGNIQVCSRISEGGNGNAFYKEILLYIPERELFEEKVKNGILSYRDLVNSNEQEEMRVKRVAKITRDNLEKRLQTETNKHLTQEQIETILNSIDFESYINECDIFGYEYNYTLHIINDPDKFLEHEGETIIGDFSERKLCKYKYWKGNSY